MPRILADLPEDDIKWLDRMAQEQGRSRAAILREAVDAYRAENSADWIERGFGLWAAREVRGAVPVSAPKRGADRHRPT